MANPVEAVAWQARRSAVAACDGAAWDAAEAALQRDWRTAFERRLLTLATGRYAGRAADLRSVAADCARTAYAEVGHDHTPAEAAEAEWAEWLASAADA